MTASSRTLFIATRGSALALAQANLVMAQCRAAFPDCRFELKIIKTTGDKLQTASMAQEGKVLPKGLFTKELEVALLNGEADLAVHSLKDLPTELPTGLKLGAVGKREDVRDVLLYRDARHQARSHGMAEARGFAPGVKVSNMPAGTVIATSSTRRKAQLLTLNPGLKLPDIRGNVATRMQKLATQPGLDATVLALAGMSRLHFRVTLEGRIEGEGVPAGLLAVILGTDEMLPCVGQGAIGIEVRENDTLLDEVCKSLDHYQTRQCVIAERAFLAGMGGGCQSPVAAHAQVQEKTIRMRAVSFTHGPIQRAEGESPIAEAAQLGLELAARLK